MLVPQKVFRVIGLILFFGIVVFFLYAFLFETNELSPLGSDYPSFITAAEIIKRGEGKDIYNLNTQLRYQQEIRYNLYNKRGYKKIYKY